MKQMASGPGLLQISGGGEDEILEAIDQIDQSLRRSVQAGQVLREPGNGSPGEATDSCGDAADSGSGGEAGEAGATGGSADDDELLARYFEDCSIFGDALKFRLASKLRIIDSLCQEQQLSPHVLISQHPSSGAARTAEDSAATRPSGLDAAYSKIQWRRTDVGAGSNPVPARPQVQYRQAPAPQNGAAAASFANIKWRQNEDLARRKALTLGCTVETVHQLHEAKTLGCTVETVHQLHEAKTESLRAAESIAKDVAENTQKLGPSDASVTDSTEPGDDRANSQHAVLPPFLTEISLKLSGTAARHTSATRNITRLRENGLPFSRSQPDMREAALAANMMLDQEHRRASAAGVSESGEEGSRTGTNANGKRILSADTATTQAHPGAHPFSFSATHGRRGKTFSCSVPNLQLDSVQGPSPHENHSDSASANSDQPHTVPQAQQHASEQDACGGVRRYEVGNG